MENHEKNKHGKIEILTCPLCGSVMANGKCIYCRGTKVTGGDDRRKANPKRQMKNQIKFWKDLGERQTPAEENGTLAMALLGLVEHASVIGGYYELYRMVSNGIQGNSEAMINAGEGLLALIVIGGIVSFIRYE